MKTPKHTWVKEFPGAIMVCDPQGIILEMNDKSEKTYEEDGGLALIGKNVLDCHPEPARGKLERMLEERQTNIYTIEKNGVKKLIYQAPWFEDGEYAGFLEMSVEIPFELPHFVRG
jgi:transcriptional regulator with PAS, ATPase and Fis domain